MSTVDLAVVAASGPAIVDKLSTKDGGVDFLGLRQANLDLMQELLPTVNNVVRHIRPYTVLAWAWWRAAELARASGASTTSNTTLTRFVERVEVLFTWSHKLAGADAGLPGNSAEPPQPVGPVPLDFGSWGRDPYSGCLMAPTQYGPSLKHPYGFGYVEPHPDVNGVFVVAEQALPAVQRLAERLNDIAPPRLFDTLDPVEAEPGEVRPLYEAWQLDRPEDIEIQVFRERFCNLDWRWTADGGRRWQRGRTVAFFRAILAGAAIPVTVPEFRLAATSRRLPTGGRWLATPELQPAATIFTLLQARQAQRHALELLLRWVEVQTRDYPLPADRLPALCARAVAGAESLTYGARSLAEIGARIEAIGTAHGGLLFAVGLDPTLDPFSIIKRSSAAIAANVDDEVAAFAIHLLMLAALLVNAVGQEDGAARHLNAAPDRVPLASLPALLQDRSDLADGLRAILGQMVIAQHFATAVTRNIDDTQRLRLSLEEEGLTFIARQPLRPSPTPDRLENLLPLLAEAGFWECTDAESNARFAVHGSVR